MGSYQTQGGTVEAASISTKKRPVVEYDVQIAYAGKFSESHPVKKGFGRAYGII